MATPRALIDSSYLYALSDIKDKYHSQAKAHAGKPFIGVVPDIVLTEVTHGLNRLIGHHVIVPFLQMFAASAFELQSVTKDDLKQAAVIMAKYASARFDFVDCCIMALSERLTITQVCTFDRRDFIIYRRPNGEPLELLP
ncbi:MAG: PIN domain-containing protein [Chloroflexi bacterium]|nr:PIN domain-containing protein [Chloroflexota bacterium]